MEIFIIIAALVFIAFAAKVLFSTTKDQAMSSNPIDGIRPNGTMGFEIGDSYAFCKSRFKHLNLSVNEDDFESESYKMGISNYGNQYVVWGVNEFENIKEVSFCFNTNCKLSSISIYADLSKMSKNDMYGILVSRISRVLGIEPFIYLKYFSKWSTGKADITLSIYPNQYCPNVDSSVVIQII